MLCHSESRKLVYLERMREIFAYLWIKISPFGRNDIFNIPSPLGEKVRMRGVTSILLNPHPVPLPNQGEGDFVGSLKLFFYMTARCA